MSRIGQYSVAALTVVVAVVAIRLGVWQLHRLEARKSTNATLLAARAMPPLDLQHDQPVAGRMAVVTGRFEPEGQMLLRNRVSRQAPGVHVITPFRPHEGAPVWVLRGFVPAADGVHPGEIPQPATGEVTITGELHGLPATDDAGAPLIIDSDTTWQRLDAGVATARAPGAAPMILYLAGGTTGPGMIREVEPPVLDNGPHLSYAIQWFAIACAALAFGFLVLRTRRQPYDHSLAPPPAGP